MNVVPVWKNNITGRGIVIAVLDDGAQSKLLSNTFNWFHLIVKNWLKKEKIVCYFTSLTFDHSFRFIVHGVL